MAPKITQFKVGEYLFREGESSTSLYLIKKGTVSIRKRKGTGAVELARIYSNEVIGELAFFDRQPRSASAVAMTEVEATEISFASMSKIFDSIPDYMKTIMNSVVERLRKADERIRKLQKDLIEDGETDAIVDDALAAVDEAGGVADASGDPLGEDLEDPGKKD